MAKKLWSLPEFRNILLISLGSILLAAGVAFFLLPAKIATGGTPGIAIIIHFMSGTSTGVAMLMVNIPLLAAGIKFIDLGFALRSIYTIIVTSILVDTLPILIDFPPINSILLATLYGGVCIGAGVGMILKGHASAGGTTIIAKILSRYWPIKPARIILTLDGLIILSVASIFADMELALWSVLSIYVTTQIIDKILTGVVSEKIVHIVSKKAALIGVAINQQLARDGTIICGQNLLGDDDKTLIFVVVEARTIPELRKIVLNIDPTAIMIVMEAAEMMGTSRKLA